MKITVLRLVELVIKMFLVIIQVIKLLS